MAITDARISQLSGATIGSQSTEITGCAFQLQRPDNPGGCCSGSGRPGPGSRRLPPPTAKHWARGFFVVDTSIYNIENIAAQPERGCGRRQQPLDLSSRPRYYRTDSSGSSDDAAVVQALFTDTYEMLAASNPAEALHDHYALVYLSSDSAQKTRFMRSPSSRPTRR